MKYNSNQTESHPLPGDDVPEGLLEGRNALQEALRSGRTIDKVWIAAGDTDRNLARLASEAREQGAVVIPVDRRKLDGDECDPRTQGSLPWPLPGPTPPWTTSLLWQNPGGRLPSLWSAMSCPTPTIWAPSSALPNAPEPMAW